MTYYELLKQYVSTGMSLSEYQFDRIKKDGQLLNSYFYSRNKNIDYDMLTKYEVEFVESNPKYFKKFDKDNWIYFMGYSSEPDEIAKMIIKAKDGNLDSFDINDLLKYTQNPYEIAKLIGIDKVNLYLYKLSNIRSFYNSKNPDKIAKMIINAKGDKLDSDDIRNLLHISKNQYEISKTIINTKGDNLNYFNVEALLEDPQNQYNLAKMIIDTKGVILNYHDISNILKYSENRDELINMIINVKGDKLNFKDINTLLEYSKDKDELINMIISTKGNKLDSRDIMSLIKYPKNPDEIKKLLIQAGVDRERIPKI